MAGDPGTEFTAAALKVLGRARKAAEAYGRPDLSGRVAHAAERFADDAYRVMVVGEFKHGKSSLVNALLGEHATPVDADIATSVPVLVRHGDEPRAEAVVGDERVAFPPEEVDRWATEAGNPDNLRRASRVEVFLPHPILAAGVALIDTPGVGGLASTHGTITAAALPTADAVLFVSDAAQELSANEVDFLRTVVRICPRTAYVLTKLDLHHNWRRIDEIDAGHLERAGVDVARFAVSSVLREVATEADDDELAAESGFGSLLRWLGREVAGRGRARAMGVVAAEVADVTAQLAARFEAERAALVAADASALTAALEQAKAAADTLRARGGRWSQAFGDGWGDLSSDVDHDMRVRTRELNRKVDDAIDAMDPADAWGEFEPWLYREAGAAVTANYELLHGRIAALVEQVCELFGDDSSAAGFEVRASALDAVLGTATASYAPVVNKRRLFDQGMTVMRQGYSSVGMFGMYAGMAGIALANPVSAALALVMGRKGLKDERERQLGQRRAQAKAAARRYLDDVNFVVGKDSRDLMRRLQRDLRDFFSARAEQASRSAAEAVAAAQDALRGTEAERKARLDDVDAELARLARLAEAAESLVGLEDEAAALRAGVSEEA